MPDRLIAHLAHVEVLSPKPEESLRFYHDVLGLEESGREGGSVYLRGWGEWDHHSLKLTESAEPGLVHIGWRMLSPQHLERAVAQVEAAGAGIGLEGRLHRPRPRLPATAARAARSTSSSRRSSAGRRRRRWRSSYPNRPQAYVPRGIAPRQIDHVTVMTTNPLDDAGWYRDILGYRFTEYTVLDDAEVPVFAMVTNYEKSHDLGLIIDQAGVPGRLHHVAYWVDSRDELLRAADILLGADIPIEFGPGRHGHGRAGLPLRARAGRRAHRGQHGRLSPVRARLGDAALDALAGLEHLLPQRRDARVDDRGPTPPLAARDRGDLNPWAASSVH